MNRFFRTDLKRSARASALVVAVLALSFTGPLISSLLRSSMESFLAENSRRVLTADIAVTAYRPVRDDEVERLRKKYGIKKKVHETEFVTMAIGAADHSALIEVHAVEQGFPIDGEFEFADGSKERAAPKDHSVWLSTDALLALDSKVGDSIRFGKSDFKIERAVKLAPGVSRATFGFAPRAYIPIETAGPTGLLGFGSQIYYRIYLETEKPVLSTDDVRDALGDPDLFLRTPDDSIQGVERFTGFVSLYLAVVSVALFSLGWAAAFYILRTQAIERMRSSAVALVFGASSKSVLAFEFLRVGILSVVAAIVAFLFSYGIARAVEPLIVRALHESVSGDFHIAVAWRDVLALLLTALASAAIFTIPFAVRLRSSKLVDLFQDSALGVSENSNDTRDLFRARLANLATGLLAIVTLGGLSVWLTRDFRFGVQLAAGFVFAASAIHISGVVVFRVIASVFSRARGGSASLLRLVGTQLSRARFAVRLSFLAVGLSAFVASAVGQIMVSLGQELRDGTKLESAPDFFLFNIPESVLQPLEAMLIKENTKLDYVSPMILARLEQVNGKPPQNEQFQKFPVRITWRESTIANERIVEGPKLEPKFDPASGNLPKISVETRFADRNELKIGDRLSFDVQGVPIDGEIGNVRRVRWIDFNPGFFISFQAGVLEDAPKTWLGNVHVTDRTSRSRVQSAIVRAFPDLSVIDVSQTIERVVGLIKAILGPAEQAALLSTVFSILVLITIVWHSTHQRAREMNLFRILGADPHRVKSLYRLEFALAAGLGSLVGAAAGVGLAWFVSVRFLELAFQFDSSRFLITVLAGVSLGTLLGTWLYTRVSRGLGFNRRVV
ncbi:ABC transporter permease [soil metagenome]